jgi:hypothetical protein
MDQVEDVTAEFKTEEIKQEAAILPTPIAPKFDLKAWIPAIVGLITLAIMATIAFRFWLFP